MNKHMTHSIKHTIPALFGMLLVGFALQFSSDAAELNITDGVVVKFGADSQFIVRDKLTAGSGITLTSFKDDSVVSQTNPTAQIPASGDWRGVRIEKSASSFGGLSLSDLTVRYAGSIDTDHTDAAFTLRGWSPTLQYVQVLDSVVGLRLLDGASPAISGSNFSRNLVGIEASGNSAPVVSSSQFVQNSSFGIQNKTPATIILAKSNWWGNASGPKDVVSNPQGLGDAVSTGVNYANYLTAASLTNPTIRLNALATFYDQRTVALDISCVNATEYRIAEADAFVGVPFTALTNGKATVPFVLTDGDGRKAISIQFRNASGTIVSASLNGGVLLDTLAPVVAITNPAAGSVITSAISVDASATDASGISRVEFYIDNVLAVTDTSTPYSYAWNTTSITEGSHVIRVVAVDGAGKSAETSTSVTVSRAPPVVDLEGPVVSNIKANGVVLVDGMTFSTSPTMTLSATDRSGVSRIEVLLNNQLATTASGSSNYSALLNLAAVANGSYVLTIRATDSLNNVSSVNYNVTVSHAVPSSPQWTSPASGTTTRNTSLSVSGTAQANSSIQLYLNGQPNGSAIIAGTDGRFTSTFGLVSGGNQIQATSTDQYGTSVLSSVLAINLDQSVPSSPANLVATAQAQGKVRLTWSVSSDPNTVGYDVYRSTSVFSTAAEAIKVNTAVVTVAAFDDLPPQDGVWFYRVVALNSAATPSGPTNQAQATSDGTAPRALSVAYTPLGKVDSATGRIGQGSVNLLVTVSEALQATPYLSIVPQGGSPITVDLTKTGNTTYSGSFVIDVTTASGTANAIFSARDAVGNRGTDIDAGATLKIDTDGPALSSIALVPGSPIKNVNGLSIQATFVYTKALKSGTTPQLTYLLSGPVRSPIAVTGLSQLNPTTWKANFQLPSDAGTPSAEVFVFSSKVFDDLDNVSTKISSANRFQVYQNNLPPLDVPLGLTAKAMPGGKVRLDWQAVVDASAYQIYRQGPADTSLQALVRATGISYVDQPTQDGAYKYAIASVRQSNGEESLSGQSASVDVRVSSNAPGAPQNLALTITGQGIYASWQPPLASTVDSYNLYRSTGTSINSIDGLTPLKTGIKQVAAIDTSPSPTQGAYVVTALDAAGNESAISNSAYLNASLLPVTNLKVQQLGNTLPVVSWNAPNGNVSGYLVYVGRDTNKVKLTSSPTSSTTFTDSGYTSGERAYTVSTVDSNGVEMPHSLLLPNLAIQIASGLPIKRGVMNKVQVQLVNTSPSTLNGVRAVVTLPINKDATQFKDHKSDAISLGPNETKLVDVIVGGYADLPTQAQAQVGVEITPNEGEFVKVAHTETVSVIDSTLVVGMETEDFTRGGVGKLKLTIENTSDVDVELLTATNNGSNDSSELRFKILDADGNVLATQPYKQVFGANVITLTNGLTVARIPAGTSYTSDVFNLNVPATSPGSIRVKLEVDKLRYHSGQADEIQITGHGSEKTVSLIDTAYTGEVTDVSPISSFGDQSIVIAGRALDRQSNAPLPNTRLKLILNQQGFERIFNLITDATGHFTYTFVPTITDSGLYKVSAVHPDITDRPEQKAFTINRVSVGPTPYKLDIPRNYAYSIPFAAKAGAGTSATNLRLVLNAASQVTGLLPVGISLQLSAPVNLAEKQTLNIPAIFTANNDAQPSGSVILDVMSAEQPNSPIGKVQINYTLSEAKPYLVSTPSYVETGLSQGSSQIESVTIQNKGLQDALNLQFTLTKSDGSPAPSWAAIASQVNGTLVVGDKRAIDLSFTPPSGTQEGVYEFKLNVQGDNVPAQALNVYASVTQSGQGNVLFKASDIYTATFDKQGHLIEGLANAKVTIQNEDVVTVSQESVTDSVGEALFQNLPAGRYKYRVKANNHQEYGGRLQIKPGITLNQPVFLDYNLVTVEWSVTEVTIQDRYDITLSATFETDVPAPVVLLQPTSVNFPKMNTGDVYYGEFKLTNYGLVRADNVRQQLPQSDSYFRYEFLVDVPNTLDAKQVVTIPYRVIALQSLEDAASTANAGGGGCYGYSNITKVIYDYSCANGVTSSGVAYANFFTGSNSSCPVGTGSSSGGGGVGGGGGDLVGGNGGYQTIPGVPSCAQCGGQCCKESGVGGFAGKLLMPLSKQSQPTTGPSQSSVAPGIKSCNISNASLGPNLGSGSSPTGCGQ